MCMLEAKIQSLCGEYMVFMHAALVCSTGHPIPASMDLGTASGIPSKDGWRGVTNMRAMKGM